MRKLIDQYAADKGKLPQSARDLITEHTCASYRLIQLREQSWTVETGEDPNSDESGIINVRSASTDTSSGGNPYSEW